MSEVDLVAPGVATEEVVTPAETPETPAEETAQAETEAEQTETQKRRERRKAAEQRILEEKAATDRKLEEANARLQRVQAAAAGHQEPKESDYTDIGAYWAAMGAFNYARTQAQMRVTEVAAEAEQAKEASKRIAAAQSQGRQEAFADAEQEARTRYADYDAVARNPNVMIAPALAEMILGSDQPADLAYHVAKNPDVSRALSTMPPQVAAFELGKIAAQMQVPQPKIASNAPAPINPVKPSGTTGKDPAKMTAAEYAAWRAAGGTF
jgi:hypothetical protein